MGFPHLSHISSILTHFIILPKIRTIVFICSFRCSFFFPVKPQLIIQDFTLFCVFSYLHFNHDRPLKPDDQSFEEPRTELNCSSDRSLLLPLDYYWPTKQPPAQVNGENRLLATADWSTRRPRITLLPWWMNECWLLLVVHTSIHPPSYPHQPSVWLATHDHDGKPQTLCSCLFSYFVQLLTSFLYKIYDEDVFVMG